MGIGRKLRNFVYDLVGFASPRTARRKIYRGKVKRGGLKKWAVLADQVTRGSVKATTKTVAMKKGRRLLRAGGVDANRVTVKKVAR